MTRLADGIVVDERYRMIDRIGSGGMAEVWSAEDLQLGRKVALKVLQSRFAQDQEFVERFRREASAAAGLQHPNVVGVFDRGEFDGTYYIAMEYVEGEPLRDVIARGVEIPWALQVTKQILAAAQFAHERGIVHRDIKPLNVLIDNDGRARVTDFGIASAAGSEITQTGTVMGTAQYLSPEQAQGLEVTPATDIYSVGIVLYELLTGQVPFDGESPVGVAMRQVSEPPVPPSQLNPNVYPALDAVVLRALAKDPRDRFDSAYEFSEAIDRAEANPYGGGLDTASYAPLPPAEDEGRKPWRWILLAVLAGLLAALAVWALTRPEAVVVPDVVGKNEQRARTLLNDAGFDVRVDSRQSERPAGRVIEQDPEADTEADEGSIVTITVSTGLGNAPVPEVNGQRESAAKEELEAAGFVVEVRREFSNDVEEGRVIRTEPPVGTVLQRGSTVTLVVSRGPDTVDVPNVVGLDQAEAERVLEEAGLSARTQEEDADEPEGEVLRQIPDAGVERERGSEVTIVISTGAGSVEVKDVVGATERNAIRRLEDQGLRAEVQEVEVSNSVDDGRVVDQDPSGGTRVVSGERVTIFVGVFTPPPDDGSGAQQQEPGIQGTGGDQGTSALTPG